MNDRSESKLESDAGRSEILYKLGQIEAKLEVYRTGWAEPVKRIEDILMKLELRTERDLVQLKSDQTHFDLEQRKIRDSVHEIRNSLHNIESRLKIIDNHETEINKIKTDISTWKVRFSTIIATVVVAWAVLGDTVSGWLSRMFN